MVRWLPLGAALAAVLVATPLRAQISFGEGGTDRYRALYGDPIEVSVDDLVRGDASYDGRAVRTRGRLDPADSLGGAYSLRGTFGGKLAIVPVNEVAPYWEDSARAWIGKDVEITGVYQEQAPTGTRGAGYVRFWEFVGPPDKSQAVRPDARVPLEHLVLRPDSYDGKTVRVVGEFRGRNLYGDLPTSSMLDRRDWVIKDELFAVWVSGRKPEGDGFKLDAGMKRDTGKWLEVVGRVEIRKGVSYVRASAVSLTDPPVRDGKVAEALATPTPTPPPPKPPVVVFALPLDGEVVPATSQFTVQFSKDMIVSSFEGRVLLRYAGPPQPGDRAFSGMKLHYDGGRRALTVDPGDVLRRGRVLELQLLPGIVDVDGLELVARGEPAVQGVAEVLRYRVGS